MSERCSRVCINPPYFTKNIPVKNSPIIRRYINTVSKQCNIIVVPSEVRSRLSNDSCFISLKIYNRVFSWS